MTKAKKIDYPRWVFATGGCGYGHSRDKSYGYYIDADHYVAEIRYDRSGSRKAGAKNWVLDGEQRFATLEEAMNFFEKEYAPKIA